MDDDLKDLKLVTLTPLKRAPRSYEFVALDTEGDGSLHGFKLAATWDETGGNIFHRKKDLREYLFTHRNRERRILCANLEYDWSVAFQPFDGHHSILLADGRWLRASYKDNDDHTWTAWDIQRIAPLSVAQMGQIIGLAKYPTPPALIDDAYHHVQHFVCDAHHRTDCIECYCLRDAEIVYKFANLYQTELNTLGGQMKMTAASCAMDLFRRRFLDEEIAPSFVRTNEFSRLGLYGGRVENFKAGTDNFINAYDFNSLYPAAMRDLRVGRPDTFHHLRHTDHLISRLDGFGVVDATVEIPSSYLPILPHRVGSRNYYLTGRVRGTWTFSEVRYAMENGCKLVDSGETIFADQTTLPFKNWVDVLYARKLAQRQTGDPGVEITKILLNSLWGKFSQRTDDDLATVIFPRGQFDYADYVGYEPHVLAGREVLLKPITSKVQSPHIHVMWAAEITAQARIRLHQMMREVDERLYYCDTDSIHTDRTLATGDGLGELKLEHRFQRVTYIAPKEYGGVDTEGHWVAHAKGIPPDQQEKFLKYGHARFTRPQHILEAMRGGGRIAEWKPIYKQRRAHPPCRDHPNLEDYNNYWVDSRPWDAEGVPTDGF